MARRERKIFKKKKSILNSNRVLIIIIAAVSVLTIGSVAAYVAFSGTQGEETVTAGEQRPDAVKDEAEKEDPYISKNIFINDVDVGGLTMEQASQKLKEKFEEDFKEKEIVVSAGDAELKIRLMDLKPSYDFAEGTRQAYDYTHTGSKAEKKEKLEKLDEEPHKVKYEPKYSFEASEITKLLEPLATEVDIPPVNATIERKNGEFFITEDSPGRKMDVGATATLVEELAIKNVSGNVEAVVEGVEATYKAAEFANAKELIGSYRTKFSAGDNGRNANIKNAASKINNTTVYPGEVFSTNKAFGAMTYDNGYRLAPVIESGKLKDDFGGGVCQVSSTLYNAVLFAELEVVERQNHSLKVGYVDYGFDATLAGDYIDFKFKNNTDYPICIEAYTDGASVTTNIYGHEIHGSGRKLSFYNTLNETVQPPAEVVKEDPSLPAGERAVDSPERTGYRYSVYKVVYDNGAEIDRVLVNNSYYRPSRGEVRVGTGPAKSPEPTEEPEEEPDTPELGQAVDQATPVPVPDDYIIVPSIPSEQNDEAPRPEITPTPHREAPIVAPTEQPNTPQDYQREEPELPVMLPGYVGPEEAGVTME